MKKSDEKTNPYLGVGLYSLSEASRLTGVSAQRIQRWLHGYVKHGTKKEVDALWKPEVPEIYDDHGLTFKDLIEIRFVDAFLRYGVSWKIIRAAAEKACKEYKQSYPFSSQKFKTDGRRIFSEISEDTDDQKLVDLVREQYTFKRVIEPSLIDVEFSGDIIERWYPLKGSKLIVIDPKRSFGKPIVFEEGISTSILNKAYEVEQNMDFVASCYAVSKASLKAAIQFEKQFVS